MASIAERFKNLFVQEAGKGKVSAVRGFFSSYGQNYELTKNYATYERIYKEVPLVQAAINYTSDLTVGVGYELISDDPREIKKVSEFLDSVNFHLLSHQIAKQLLVYGNSFVELVRVGDQIVDVKMLHPKTMEVVLSKDGTGEVVGYKQNVSVSASIDFAPNEIAHFYMNVVDDSAVGTSAIECIRGVLGVKLQMEQDLKLISHRYAAPQVHYKLGSSDEPATIEQIDDFENQLNDHNPEMDLITNYNISADVLRPLGSKIGVEEFLKHIEQQVVAGLQVPEVALGLGQNITEATAKVQVAIFDRRVKSIQEVLTAQINTKIIDQITRQPGLVELEFGEFSKEDEDVKVNRLLRLKAAGVVNAQYVAKHLGIDPTFIPPEPDAKGVSQDLKGLDDSKTNVSPRKQPLKEGFYYVNSEGELEGIDGSTV